MTRTHYVRHGNVITLPERHTPRLELVGRHDVRRLMDHGLGRHPYTVKDFAKDAVGILLMFLAWGAMLYGLGALRP